MTSPVASVPTRRAAPDGLLLALAAGAVALSIAGAIAGEVLHLAVPVVLVVVLGALGLALRITMVLRARRSTALADRRVLGVVSSCGLGLSALAALVTIGVVLPRTTPQMLLTDIGLHVWTIAILLVATAPARTIGWRALLGTALAGFLAVSALARAAGTPVIDWLGVDNPLAVSVWVPLTEEVLKAAPALLVVLLSLRAGRRPTAVDIALLGFMSGTGFAVIENADYGRVSLGASTPLAVLYPTIEDDLYELDHVIVAGHAVWTGLVAMGLGFGLLYARRFRWAWAAIPVTLAVVLLEHGQANAGSEVNPPQIPILLTADGLAAVTLLTVGLAALTVFERAANDPRVLWRDGLLLRPRAVAARRALAATRQRAAHQGGRTAG